MKNDSPSRPTSESAAGSLSRSDSLRSNLRLKMPPSTAISPVRQLSWSAREIASGRFKTGLYRFLAENIPAIHSCLWTWTHLASAPGKFKAVAGGDRNEERANVRLKLLSDSIMAAPGGRRLGLAGMIPELFTVLFRDGIYGGFVVLSSDGSRVDQFVPVDPADIRLESSMGQPGLFLETAASEIDLHRPEFFYLPYNADVDRPFGRSLLQAVPFVAYIEQQLIDDMRRSSHNSGFHRLHVKITPPERMSGESDAAYTNRVNAYFDSTVDMIKSCDIDDNPVTWDNVLIDYVGPDKSRDVTNSWFMSHRAMIEEICAATNLAPYLLGYSYGATTTWAAFKFDVVMRHVRSVQAQAAQLLEWLGNLDLALAGIEARCEFHFDNSFAYQVKDDVAIQSSRIDNVLKLFQAGLIDEAAARQKAWEIL
jgi:hypothetical protein